MQVSTRLLIVGLILFAAGVGLFFWGLSGDLTAASDIDPAEPMRRIGQVSGAVAGLGTVIFAIGVFQRLRGR